MSEAPFDLDDYEVVLENLDVPEPIEADPFEDAITDELLMLELLTLDPTDLELL
jgi:hypothetical protein